MVVGFRAKPIYTCARALIQWRMEKNVGPVLLLLKFKVGRERVYVENDFQIFGNSRTE